ncbi:hypothetical protein PI125_g23240 [Phytophthora idaei]|nr:hypothetical protein PI125_g23240 [Phytophthora idaei]KAG3125087.1 hypothetical protein PI126_g22930 [Phytophthora idaei]
MDGRRREIPPASTYDCTHDSSRVRTRSFKRPDRADTALLANVLQSASYVHTRMYLSTDMSTQVNTS